MFVHLPHTRGKIISRVLGLMTLSTLALTACSPAVNPGTPPSASASKTASPSVTKPSQSPKSPATPTTSTAPATKPLSGKVIVLDPGHGKGRQLSNPISNGRGGRKICNTSGTATNAGYPEYKFTWRVADYLRNLLQEQGATVVLTRDNGPNAEICVDRRGKLANEKGAAALISIHGNGSESNAPHGFFVMVSNPPLNAAQGEPSRKLARAVATGLRGAGLSPSTTFGANPVPRSDLATLNFAQVPAVMVELGEMRNPQDAQRMSSPEGQQQYAAGLAQGILSYFSAG